MLNRRSWSEPASNHNRRALTGQSTADRQAPRPGAHFRPWAAIATPNTPGGRNANAGSAVDRSLRPVAARGRGAGRQGHTGGRLEGARRGQVLDIQGSGVVFQVGQSYTPGQPWPQFNVRTFNRVVNYETASLRDDLMRTRALEPPKGGGAYVHGEHRQVFVLSGDHAWNVVGENPVAAPIALSDRQFQFWSTPHGIIKAAMANPAGVQDRTIAFGNPGRFRATASLDAANLVERVEAPPSIPSSATWPSR